jgi:hypothetical protein
MIDINLVPLPLRKRSSHGFLKGLSLNLPQDFLLGVGGGFVLLLLATHLLLGAVMLVNVIRVASVKAQWQGLLPDKNNLDIIATEVKDLRKKMTTISDITAKRSIGWSRNLNVVSDHLSSGIWLKRIALDNKALVMEGFAVSKIKNEVNLVGGFVSNLKKDQQFMRAFTGVEVNAIQRVKRGTTEIAEFTVTAKLQ